MSVRAEAHGRAGLTDVDLAVAPGEIVGVAGVSGNGQRELGDVILGVESLRGRAQAPRGRRTPPRWPVREIRAGGVVFIPEDALGLAAVRAAQRPRERGRSATRARYARAGGLALDWAAARADLDARLRATRRHGAVRRTRRSATLSGGNVQRVILARELAHAPRLIVAFYPTRGLDARSARRPPARAPGRARDAGAGVLLISEDLDELFALADRLVVLFRGRVVGAGGAAATSRVEEIGHLMTGSRWWPRVPDALAPPAAARGRRCASSAAGVALASSRRPARLRPEPAERLRRHLREHARRARTGSPRRS